MELKVWCEACEGCGRTGLRDRCTACKGAGFTNPPQNVLDDLELAQALKWSNIKHFTDINLIGLVEVFRSQIE